MTADDGGACFAIVAGTPGNEAVRADEHAARVLDAMDGREPVRRVVQVVDSNAEYVEPESDLPRGLARSVTPCRAGARSQQCKVAAAQVERRDLLTAAL